MKRLPTQVNPYESPATGTDSEALPSSHVSEHSRSRFRLRVIPACISWLIGGLVLLAMPFAVYNNWKYLGVDFGKPLPWVLLDIMALATLAVMTGFGFAWISAGNRWMKGRWTSAIALNVLPYLLLLSFMAAIDYLKDWASSLV